MTVIAQDDHLTAGAWATCGNSNSNSITTLRGLQRVFAWRVTAPKFAGWRVLNPNNARDAELDITTWCVIFYFTSAWRVIYMTYQLDFRDSERSLAKRKPISQSQ